MTASPALLRVRDAHPDDAEDLCALLNSIIAIGGTTAFEIPFTPPDFAEHFITGPHVLCCLVAEGPEGRLGFQALERYHILPPDWADIATFAHRSRSGIGTALFAATRARARALGLTRLNATIRADNAGGLAFYSRMGFVDDWVHEAVPLQDGTPFDRICKRFEIARD